MQLRDELLDGRYAAGTRLREEELAERFEVGRHTVRSAIRLLVERGLLAVLRPLLETIEGLPKAALMERLPE